MRNGGQKTPLNQSRCRRHRDGLDTRPVTSMRSAHLALREGRRPGDFGRRSEVRCPRAGACHSRARAAWASACRHYDRRVRCSLDWDRRARVTPVEKHARLRPGWRSIGSQAPAESQEAWLKLRLGDEQSPWREPQWNAGRRARPAGRAPHLASAELRLAPFGVLLPFLSFVLSFVFGFRAAPDRDGSGPPLPGSSDKGRECGEVFGTGVLNSSGANQKTHRENENLFPLPPTRAARGGEGLGVGGTFLSLGVRVEVVPPPPTHPRPLPAIRWRERGEGRGRRIARMRALVCCPHPEARAQRASKDAGRGAGASPFEGRFAAASG